jgi:hypothetical protein
MRSSSCSQSSSGWAGDLVQSKPAAFYIPGVVAIAGISLLWVIIAALVIHYFHGG